MTAEDVVARLKANPMYQLSTAGQELFHSNMLYWLAKEKPDESAKIWKLFGAAHPTEAYRELRHIDLQVDSVQGRLILENKVLALPDQRQLDQYVDKLFALKEPDYRSGTSWWLLSLAPPAFEIAKHRGVTWRYCSYAELLPALRATLTCLTDDDRTIFSRYVDLVQDLVALTEEFDPKQHLDEPFLFSDTDLERLRAARLVALVRKQQMSRCAEILKDRLATELRFTPDQLVLGAGISTKSKAGIIQHFQKDTSGRFMRELGWQVEGSALRLVGILNSREAKRIPEELRGAELQTAYPEFFSFDFDDGFLLPYKGNKTWLRYGATFRYQYRLFPPSTTWRRLIDTLMTASQRTVQEISASDRSGS
ncbi:PD-(D/E)XK nuclease family protein [Gordonia bronchialis]|uniref:PD-(D/E)XK nuclease family protein n=1 Tax=Gordonia bronchialis TaxID=2054 RepID=UPI001CC043E9|nr:PD-(D/E)XK nuclease family protein [Gordonia bronchialis]UAK39174.1 PD-(D/E)XK nuclease family protein [Gordonia bronchialis]